jgi:hypothetical protein
MFTINDLVAISRPKGAPRFSITNSQEVFPLLKVALEAPSFCRPKNISKQETLPVSAQTR